MVAMMRRGPCFDYDVYLGILTPYSTHTHVANNTSMGTLVLSSEDGHLYANRRVCNELVKHDLCMQMLDNGEHKNYSDP